MSRCFRNFISCMFLVLLFIFLVFSVFSFSGSSISYSLDTKHDSFAQTNSTSDSFAQRFVGGFQAVSQYVSDSFAGRFGILATAKNLIINISSPINNLEIVRGGDSVSGEDDKGFILNSVNFTAQIYDSSDNSGFSSATCYFYESNVLIGSSSPNSSGHCTMNFSKSTLNPAVRNVSVNYSISTSDVKSVSNAQANYSLVKYVTTLNQINKSTNGKYYGGDLAILEINITKTNVSGEFDYDPQNISANATDAALNIYPGGELYYFGNITRISQGRYRANVTINYSFANELRWDVFVSDDNLTNFLSTAVHADVAVCSADFGAWSDWSACSGSLQTRSRTDSSGCSEVETQSCTTTPPTSCFPAGTQILMGDGNYKNIEDVKIGEFVLSYDFDKNKTVRAEVLDLESPIREGYYKIISNGDNIINVTDEHPFYIKKQTGELGWGAINISHTKEELGSSYLGDNELISLEIGDFIFNNEGNWIQVDYFEYVEGEIQTFNLKSIDKYNDFFVNDLLVHNKGGGTTCTDADGDGYSVGGISCGDVDCNDKDASVHPRTKELCSDGVDNNCDGNIDCKDGSCAEELICQIPEEIETICNDGVDNDEDGFIDCFDGDCKENSICKLEEYDCTDKIDNDDDGAVDCRDTDCVNDIACSSCVPDWECTDWTLCTAKYDITNTLILSNKNFSGEQSRNCVDKRDCSIAEFEVKSCSVALPVEMRKTQWCYQDYVEIYNKETNKLVSRIKDTSSSQVKGLEIGLIETNFEGYCSYCYDGVKNFDEEKVDCGGDNCKLCVDEGTFFDWIKYLIIVLWILLALLSARFAWINRKSLIEDLSVMPRAVKELFHFGKKKRIGIKEISRVSGRERKGIGIKKFVSGLIPRIKFSVSFRSRAKKTYRVEEIKEVRARSRVAERLRKIKSIKFRRPRPFTDLKNKLEKWQRAGYYATAGLEAKLSSVILNYGRRRIRKVREREGRRKQIKIDNEIIKEKKRHAKEMKKVEKERMRHEREHKKWQKEIFKERKKREEGIEYGRKLSEKRHKKEMLRTKRKERNKKITFLLASLFGFNQSKRVERKVKKQDKRIAKQKKKKLKEIKKSAKRELRRIRKEERKIHRKKKKNVKREARKIKKRIRKKQISNNEVTGLKKQLEKWQKEGYYNTTKLRRKLDEYK